MALRYPILKENLTQGTRPMRLFTRTTFPPSSLSVELCLVYWPLSTSFVSLLRPLWSWRLRKSPLRTLPVRIWEGKLRLSRNYGFKSHNLSTLFRFWEKDIREVRRTNRSTMRKMPFASGLSNMARSPHNNNMDVMFEKAVQEATDNSTFRTVKRMSYANSSSEGVSERKPKIILLILT